MNFIVTCLDHPGMIERRTATTPLHRNHLAQAPLSLLVSGPVTNRNGEPNGSFFLYEGDDIDALEKFVKADPFSREGIWKSVEIRHFLKRTDNRASLPVSMF